jgi:hypothetical protein
MKKLALFLTNVKKIELHSVGSESNETKPIRCGELYMTYFKLILNRIVSVKFV